MQCVMQVMYHSEECIKKPYINEEDRFFLQLMKHTIYQNLHLN